MNLKCHKSSLHLHCIESGFQFFFWICFVRKWFATLASMNHWPHSLSHSLNSLSQPSLFIAQLMHTWIAFCTCARMQSENRDSYTNCGHFYIKQTFSPPFKQLHTQTFVFAAARKKISRAFNGRKKAEFNLPHNRDVVVVVAALLSTTPHTNIQLVSWCVKHEEFFLYSFCVAPYIHTFFLLCN